MIEISITSVLHIPLGRPGFRLVLGERRRLRKDSEGWAPLDVLNGDWLNMVGDPPVKAVGRLFPRTDRFRGRKVGPSWRVGQKSALPACEFVFIPATNSSVHIHTCIRLWNSSIVHPIPSILMISFRLQVQNYQYERLQLLTRYWNWRYMSHIIKFVESWRSESVRVGPLNHGLAIRSGGCIIQGTLQLLVLLS